LHENVIPVYLAAIARKKKRRRTVILLLGLAVLLCVVPMAVLVPAGEKKVLPSIVLRVDDIQDYAFREAQLFLLEESSKNGIPLSLAVIPGMFGKDTEVARAVKSAVASGSEVTVHGWVHEDMTDLSLDEQISLLSRSRDRMWEMFGRDTSILVPPMFKFNDDTISAMQKTGYNVISASTVFSEPGLFSNVLSLPGTVNLSVYSENSTWEMKKIDSVQAEIAQSLAKYGFAVIVTHPQEFLVDGKLNRTDVELFRSLLGVLKTDYSFTTLDALRERVVNSKG
jgi:peptidoglycan/xylan/chitin deacetylase (PgdA/CDA1 family)